MKSSDPDYDYGIILLPAPDDGNERFAYSTTIEELAWIKELLTVIVDIQMISHAEQCG